MRKLDIDNKTGHKRDSVMNGFGPHRILEMEIKKALSKVNIAKDIFDINIVQWRDLEGERK